MKPHLLLSALLAAVTLGCASPKTAPQAPDTWECWPWDRAGDIHIYPMADFVAPEVKCHERLCTGSNGQCYYGCPEEKLPKFCEFYK